jgi:hypothetical protein
MSILDFTTGLFREPATLRSFVDDPDQALEDAGLPDVTPEQVHDLLPVVAESMPPDHPLQTVVHSADPVRALAELDIDELVADLHHHHHHHHHHHPMQLVEKALGTGECRPGDDEDDFQDDEPAETIHIGHWDLVEEVDKGLGELFAPQIAEGDPAPTDAYPDPRDEEEPGHARDDHALDDGGVDLDIGAVAWGKTIE